MMSENKRNRIFILGSGPSGIISKILLQSIPYTLRLYKETGYPEFPKEIVDKLKKLSEYEVVLIGNTRRPEIITKYLPIYFSFRESTPKWYRDYWLLTLNRLTNVEERKVRFGSLLNRRIVYEKNEDLVNLYAKKLNFDDNSYSSKSHSLRFSADLSNEFRAFFPSIYYIHAFAHLDLFGKITQLKENQIRVNSSTVIDVDDNDICLLTFFCDKLLSDRFIQTKEISEISAESLSDLIKKNTRGLYVRAFIEPSEMIEGRRIYNELRAAKLDYVYVLDKDLPYFRVTVHRNSLRDDFKCVAEYLNNPGESKSSLTVFIPQGKIVTPIELIKVVDSNIFFVGRGGRKDKSRTTDILAQLLDIVES